MRRIWTVAKAEYGLAVKTKAFIISIVIMPILMGGMIVLQPLLKDTRDIEDQRVAVIDLTGGEVLAALEKGSRERDEKEIRNGKGEQVYPRYLLEEAPAQGDLAQTQLELADRVRARKLFGYAVIEKGIFDEEGEAGVSFHSQANPREIRAWIAKVVNDLVHEKRFENSQIALAEVQRKLRPVPVRAQDLAVRGAGGEIEVAKEDTSGQRTAIGAILSMLMFMMVMMGAPRQLNCVIEEKMQRISEVLLGSVPPLELMLGKLLSGVGVTLTLALLYLGGGFIVAQRFGVAEALTPELMIWFIVFTVPAVFMFGALFIAVGAACSEIQDSQSLMMPVMLVVMIPMFFWGQVIREPNSSLATIVSLLPFASPQIMLTRVAIPPGPPTVWEPVLGVVISLVTAGLCVVAAGRIFRVGLLMQGQTPKLHQLIGWIFRS